MEPHPPRPSHASAPRFNVSVACNECRRSKARCDAVDPCFHCRRKKMPCVYPVDPVKRGPKKGTKYKKRQKLEDGVAARVGSDEGNEGAAGPAPVEPARVKVPSSPAPRPAPRRAAPARVLTPDVVAIAELDIPLEIVHHLVTLFFSHVNNQAFPILREDSFLASFADGCISPSLLYAICAAASRFSTHPALDATSSEACAASARRSSAKQDDALQAVQTHAILSVHELARGNGRGAWLDAGFAMRTAQVERFDDHSVDVEDDGVREDRQRIVWCLWALEAVMGCGSSSVSLTGGGSSSAMELLPLPTSRNAPPSGTGVLDDEVSSREDDVPAIFLKGGRVFHSISSYGVEPFLCRALHILANINRHVISSQARTTQPKAASESKSTTHYPSSSLPDTPRLRDWDASSQFGQLSLDMNAWSAQLPAQLAFNANVTANLPPSSISPFYTMHLVLHLGQVLLHRPYIPDYRYQCRQVPLPSPSDGFGVFASACHRKAAVHAINFARTLVACTKSATFAISPLAGYGAFTAATALLFDVELGATSNSAASQALQFFLDYLLTGSEYFYSLKSYHEVLSRLIVIHRTTAVEPAGSTDIKNPSHFFERYASAGIVEPSLAPLEPLSDAPLVSLPVAAVERPRSERDTTADAASHLLQLAEIMDDFLHAPTTLTRPTSSQAGPVQHRLLVHPHSHPHPHPANVPAFPDGGPSSDSFSWLFHHGAPAPDRPLADNGHVHDDGTAGDIWENEALEALLSSCEWQLYPGEERPKMDAGFYHGHLD